MQGRREVIPLAQRRRPLAVGVAMSPDGNVGDTGLKDVPEQVEQEGQASLSSGSRGRNVEIGIHDEAEI